MPSRTPAPPPISGLGRDDRGTTIPLILGFFIIALLMVTGSIAASDAGQDQRNLQNMCDGAALAGAGALEPDEAYTADLAGRGNLPLGVGAEDAILDYLYRDSQRSDVTIEQAQLHDDGSLTLVCTATMDLAFGAMFARPDGITHRASASARAPMRE